MYQFERNARVCFFGDSITHAGHWLRRVYEHYRERGIGIALYNCGVSGTTASRAKGARYDLLYCHKPTDVVLMFGMNDVGRHLYDGRPATGEVILERRMRIDTCVASIAELAAELDKAGIRLTFCTPTPYDEITPRAEKCLTGVAAALHEVGERVTELAQRYGGHTVDFGGEMSGALREWYLAGDSMIGGDRVHPDLRGHELMAQIFLKSQGFDIKIPKTPAEAAALAERPHDEWETERYRLEQEAKSNDLLDWCMYATVRSADIRCALLAEMAETSPDPDWVNRARNYLASDLDRDEAMARLVKHTRQATDTQR